MSCLREQERLARLIAGALQSARPRGRIARKTLSEPAARLVCVAARQASEAGDSLGVARHVAQFVASPGSFRPSAHANFLQALARCKTVDSRLVQATTSTVAELASRLGLSAYPDLGWTRVLWGLAACKAEDLTVYRSGIEEIARTDAQLLTGGICANLARTAEVAGVPELGRALAAAVAHHSLRSWKPAEIARFTLAAAQGAAFSHTLHRRLVDEFAQRGRDSWNCRDACDIVRALAYARYQYTDNAALPPYFSEDPRQRYSLSQARLEEETCALPSPLFVHFRNLVASGGIQLDRPAWPRILHAFSRASTANMGALFSRVELLLSTGEPFPAPDVAIVLESGCAVSLRLLKRLQGYVSGPGYLDMRDLACFLMASCSLPRHIIAPLFRSAQALIARRGWDPAVASPLEMVACVDAFSRARVAGGSLERSLAEEVARGRHELAEKEHALLVAAYKELRFSVDPLVLAGDHVDPQLLLSRICGKIELSRRTRDPFHLIIRPVAKI
ncbi:hypothetical protein DIPPA_24819 [Diplonema papillatum]|nr:hypothetical protein DIPPA_24819 [Diplonema papillatum]